MTDICKYRFQFCTKKKTSLLSKSFYESMTKSTLLCPKIFGRGRKELPIKLCEKNADRIYAVFICMMQTTFIPALSLESLVK